jgi:hypothetical protein
VATVRGTYTGPVATGFDPVNDTTDDDVESVAVEDLAIQKSVAVPDPVVQGSIVTYSLRVRTSEYRRITDAVITDILSDAQCPATPEPDRSTTPSGSTVIETRTRTRTSSGSPDGLFGTADDVTFDVVSEADGAVDVSGLPAGTYRLVIDTATIPSGLGLVGPQSITFELGAGETLTTNALVLRVVRVPPTGASSIQLGQIAVLLLVAGFVLFAAARTRRRPV